MFGLSIISTKELKKLKETEKSFGKKIGEKNEENYHLSERVKTLEKEVQTLTRQRDEKGRFIKK